MSLHKKDLELTLACGPPSEVVSCQEKCIVVASTAISGLVYLVRQAHGVCHSGTHLLDRHDPISLPLASIWKRVSLQPVVVIN